MKPGTNEVRDAQHQIYVPGGGGGRGASPSSCTSLHIPDLTEEWSELVVIHSPGHQHLSMVVIERPKFRQATQKAGKMLRVLGLVNLAQFL